MTLLQYETPAALAQDAAHRLAAALPTDRPFHLALSGGRISKPFYQEIVLETRRLAKAWPLTHYYFTDERCVPPTDPESNYLLARQNLFDPLQIQSEQIHRLRGEVEEDYAVKEAEAELCRLAPLDPTGQPILDLVILGMGEDGHTASLFPGEPETLLHDTAIYRAVTAIKPPPRRITLGYAPLKAAREIWVLASGPGKEPALKRVLSEKNPTLPLGRVLHNCNKALILSDIPGSDQFPHSF